MSDVSEFREVYLEELQEQLQMLEEEILRLEEEGESEDGVQRMFRAIHTLKGSSAAMGFDRMKSLTHEMEHWLDKIRNHETVLTRKMIDLFFSCLDRMKKLQIEIVHQNQELSDIDDLVRQLKALDQQLPQPNNVEKAEDEMPDDIISFLPQTLSPGQNVFLVHITLADDSIMKLARLNVIEVRLQGLGDILWKSTESTPSTGDENITGEKWLLVTELNRDEIGESLTSLMDVQSVEIQEISLEKAELPDHQQTVSAASDSPNLPANDTGEKYKSNTIRVNVDRLEHLMNYVGELVIEQTRIQQLEKHFRQKLEAEDLIEELSSISDQLNRIVGEIQGSVMQVRMLPIEQLFSRFPRMVRDLAQSLHKEVQLVLEGKETELDRSLIEEIGDPMIHLIRNAIDHGIESPEIRRAAGKPEKGTLRIEAAHEDNSVLITIQDDGAGIDANKIRQAAIDKGLLTTEAASQLTDHEAIQLIFHPGFSTAKQLSDVSGRGVGMDIVRTDIERLNGMIGIKTEIGRGTTFQIKLPLTLAIITGLLVNIGSKVFVFPMSNVAEIVRIHKDQMKKVKGIPVLAQRDQIIPLVWLHDYFQIPRLENRSETLQVVIIGRAEKKLAIVVDELKGNQEVVIKTLGSFIGKLDGITGATILGDGQVALILEVSGIFRLVEGLNVSNTNQP